MGDEPALTPTFSAIFSLPQGKVGDKGSLGFPGPPGPEVGDALFLCVWLHLELGVIWETKAQRGGDTCLSSLSK